GNWYELGQTTPSPQTNISVSDIEIDGNKVNEPAYYESSAYTGTWTNGDTFFPATSIHKSVNQPAGCGANQQQSCGLQGDDCIKTDSITDQYQVVYDPHYAVFIRLLDSAGNVSPVYESPSGPSIPINGSTPTDGAGQYSYLKVSFPQPQTPA